MQASVARRSKSAIEGGVRSALIHDSAKRHVSGEAIYTDDIPEPPGMLHVYIAMSTRAHAAVVAVDLSRVRAAPGVALVLTAKDIPGVNDVSPIAGDDPMFADGLVQYAGQSLFAVAAETLAQARAAAGLADIRYEDRPAILTIDQAMEVGSFLEPPCVSEVGEPDDVIAASPYQLSGRLRVGGQEHFYLEGQVALAVPGEGNDVTVYSSTQHPSEVQHKVAHVLGVPNHAVTVEVRRLGGGFGGKESQANLPAAAAALAAKMTRRPAKVRYDRDDDMIITGKRHDCRIDFRVGFDGDGRILGIVFEHALGCGMSFDLSAAVADRALCHADNAYFIPHMRFTSYRCKTHTQSNTAFRGFGGPQGMIGIERVIEDIAQRLGTDPLSVRRANFYAHKDRVPVSGPQLTPYGQPVGDCIIEDIVDELALSSDYEQRRRQIRQWNKESPILKRGIAITPLKFGVSFNKTFLNQAGALINIYSDGSIRLSHGGIEMGQGLYTKVAQVVAEELQVDIGRVKIAATSTSLVPNTSATAASSGSDLNGMAARDAARKIKDRIVSFLAERFQASPADIMFLPNQVRVKDAEIAFDDVVREAYMARVSLSATGFYATPKIYWDSVTNRGRPFFYYAYGAAVSEVAIDTLTGESRILRADILHDAGRSLNPAIDLGQIEGGYIQGAGWLTTEELVWDDQGRLRTHAPSTYKIPACSDRPPDMRIRLWERGENVEDTIHRSKAVGEPPLMLAISVLMALADAVASVGDYAVGPALDAPATPERILVAVERVKALAAVGSPQP